MNKPVKGRKRRRNVRRKRALLLSGIGLAVVLVAFLSVYLVMRRSVNKVAAGTIWDNIYIEDIDVSGMNAKKAKAALEEKVSEYHKEKVTLIAEDVEAEVTLEELGLKMNDTGKLVGKAVSVGKKGSVWSRHREMKELEAKAQHLNADYSVDSEAVKKVISEKIPHLKNEAVNATIIREDGKFVITDGQKGTKVDLDKSVEILENYFDADWKPKKDEKIELTTMVDEPDITREDLEQIQSELGTFSTSFNSGSNRGKNIKHAASLINGMLLMPGEEASASDAMGSRTAENGYLEAGSYLDGQTVQTYGGGVCQVSTTLYNAVILAELEITERWSHSMTVDYVKPSMDAAISEGYKDLKFKNNTDAPIYIEGYTTGGKLTFTVYGKDVREAGRKVSYVSEVTSKTEAKKKFVASGDEVGVFKKSSSGHDGIKSKLWKVVTVNGSEVSREAFNSSNYQSSTATWKVGTATDNAEAKKILTDAIATQDEAKIKAAIESAKALIASTQTSATPTTPEPTPTPTPDTGSDNGGEETEKPPVQDGGEATPQSEDEEEDTKQTTD